MLNYTVRSLDIMRSVYESALEPDAPCAEAPQGALKVQLRAHQQAALYAMEKKERCLTQGLDCSGEIFYSSYAILGDSVGVGKSLMVLGHIARLATIPPLKSSFKVASNSSGALFSLKETKFTDLSEAGSLIVVPHTLFRQWADYIKKQTNLKALLLDKKKTVTDDAFQRAVMEADVVLVSNTMYKDLSRVVERAGIKWKRAFFDEADTIHVVSGYPKPCARFTWFITASWMNILFPNETLYVSNNILNTLVFNIDSNYSAIRPYFERAFQSNTVHNYYRFYITSNNFFREYLNSVHKLRYNLVLHCSDAFIKQSISLPPLIRRNIACKAPVSQRIVSELVPAEVQKLLHAGDLTGAIQSLGVKTEDTSSIIEAVTRSLNKEMDRLTTLYTFKQGLEYSSPAAKETALKGLEDKMAHVRTSIESIKQRIANFKEEVCPICFDEPQEPCVTPCCSRIFCAQCILTCLTRNVRCPLCREQISASKLTAVVTTGAAVASEKNEIVESSNAAPTQALERKPDALLRLFRENPQGRFLVFSSYDNPFTAMESTLETMGVKVKQLKGNKDSIAATLRSFQGGDLRCLLLNSHYAGSGLNITAATHVVLLHSMTHEEEKQIVGRAYRMGRTEPLNFIRLLHEDEMPVNN